MPYNLQQMKDAGLYLEAPATVDVGELSGGKIISDIPDLLKLRLARVGGGQHNDPSRQDASDVTALLKCGLNPQDAYATFAASARGKDAESRKASHFEDYAARTVRAAMAFLGKTVKDYENKTVHIDFGKRRHAGKSVTKDPSGFTVENPEYITPEAVRWLWRPYIPAGKITIIASDPGVGKSTIAIDLAARISCGRAMPGSGERLVTGYSLIASAEDAADDTITPRLIAAGANRAKLGLLREVEIEGQLSYFSLPRDLNRLRQLVVRRGARLLVIDPINAFLSKETSSHVDQDVRLVLGPLENLAEETGCAILIVMHLTKKEDTAMLYRVGGSIGFVGAARSVLGVKEMGGGAEGSRHYVLFSLKRNLSKRPPAHKYSIATCKIPTESDRAIYASKIRWEGTCDFDPQKVQRGEGPQELKDCYEFCSEMFVSDSEMPANDLMAAAKLAGVSWSTLRYYKRDLGITSKKSHGHWYWCAPAVGFKKFWENKQKARS